MISASVDLPLPEGAVVVGGWLEVSGWAVADEAITSIELQIDGGAAVRAHHGFPRPDVHGAHPGKPQAGFAGFWCNLPVPDPAGEALTLSIEDAAGARQQWRMPLQVSRRVALPAAALPAACPWCLRERSLGETGIRREPYQLLSCAACRTGVVSPLPPLAYLKDYYDHGYWQHRERNFAPDAEHYDSEAIATMVRALHPACQSITEIGCGPGLLLNGLRKRGFVVQGVDFSAEAARVGLTQFGIQIQVGSVTQARPAPTDCIVMRHALEHSLDPRGDLKAIVAALNPGGIALLVVPNQGSLAASWLGSDWEWFIPPAHLFYFTAESFGCFAQQHGVELVSIRTRQGDGVPALEAIGAAVGYQGPGRQPDNGRRARWAALKDVVQGPSRAAIEQGIAELGLGNELVVVLRKPLQAAAAGTAPPAP